MLRKTGILHKTFLFAGLLITVVTLVSFAILYFAMPPFYRYKKEQSLKTGIARLEEALKKTDEQAACAELISDFAKAYNVLVISVDRQGKPVIPLSSPFVSLTTREEGNGKLTVNGELVDEELLSSIISQYYRDMAMGENRDISQWSDAENAFLIYDINNVYDMMLLEADIGTDLIDRLQIQGNLQPIDEAGGVILALIPYALVAGCSIGLCLAWIYASHITKPILELSAAAVRMMNMEQVVISGIHTDDELGLLSDNMNALYQSLSLTIEDLKKEMGKVNRLEKSKTEMMQSASHELKTPIAALSGMLDGMIDNIGVYKDKERYLLKCKDRVEKLSLLVKEILDASKADRRDQEENRVETEVGEMIRKILGEYDIRADEKHIGLNKEIHHVMIKTDPVLLYRAIFNLIGNAVTYTPVGGDIRIVLSNERLVIENECVPIPDEEMQKLFEPFYTRSKSRDRMVSGTGLGLYIVKRNLERLAIPYQAESTKTGFKITLEWV